MKLRVNSIFAKIVLWLTATVGLSLVGFAATSYLTFQRIRGRDNVITRLNDFLLDEARRAYEQEGAAGLSAYITRLNSYSRFEFVLTDRAGVDLITGEDRSALLSRGAAMGRDRPWRLISTSDRPVRLRDSDDRRYRLATILPRRIGGWDWIWYFAWLPVLLGILAYVLAVHLASPLRLLRHAVERFGRGELGVRAHLDRKDELGDLARSFNRMAGQIETLLSAERRLLQDVSHELRSPLARLGFAIELVRSSPDLEGSLQRIRKEAGRLNHLVDELLELTRTEGDPSARHFEDVDLAAMIADLISLARLEATAAGCRLVPRLLDGSVEVVGSRELLWRACENILRNAIRHAPAGTDVDIDLGLRDGRVAITIRDRGPGVPAHLLAEIFRPFYRVDDARARSDGGVGLGLAIANRAVLLHSGQITARNLDRGFEVEIKLPLPDSRSLPAPSTTPRIEG